MGFIETIKLYAKAIQLAIFIALVAALGVLFYIHKGTVAELETCRAHRDLAVNEVTRLAKESNNERETCGELRKKETVIDTRFEKIKEEIKRSTNDETVDGDISDYDVGRILCEQGLGDKKQCQSLYPDLPVGKLPK